MPSSTPTRRTVVRTAAWSVPDVTLATAAPAFAYSPTQTYLSLTGGSSIYEANRTLPSPQPLGDWEVAFSGRSVLHFVGSETDIPEQSIEVSFFASEELTQALRDAGIETVSGTVTLTYTQLPATAQTFTVTFPVSGTVAPYDPLMLEGISLINPYTANANSGHVTTRIGDITATLTSTPTGIEDGAGTIEFTGSTTLVNMTPI